MAIRNKYLILTILTAAYALSFMDRYVMNLLLEDVKKDFQLSELQAGLLAGAGFAVLYALMALPMGILADRKGRAQLASAGVAVWSVMTMCCGLAGNFFQMLLGRLGVGVGEAALTPAAYPIIKNIFPDRKLSTALGIYASGIYLGSGQAYWLGGKALSYIRESGIHHQFSFIQFDWQLVFLLFGLPGLLIAALLLLVKLPATDGAVKQAPDFAAFKQFIARHNYSYLKLALASSLFNVAVYAAGVWLPAYLQRVHHLSVIESGGILGAAMIFVAPIGAIAGGLLGDRAALRSGIIGRVRAIEVSLLLIIICFVLLGIDIPGTFRYAPLFGLCLLLGAPVAITAAIVQQMTPENLRSTSTAFLLMLQNLIGMSLGPALVALLTQYVFKNNLAVGLSISVTGVVFCTLALVSFTRTKRILK